MAWIFLLSFIILSCSDEIDWNFQGDLAPPQLETTSFDFIEFNTRLSPELAISGELCTGGEVAVAQDRSFTCESGQWLVYVDTVNTCTSEGCTDFSVAPVIADLVPRGIPEEASTFNIVPIVPVSLETESTLKDSIVILDPANVPVVVFGGGI